MAKRTRQRITVNESLLNKYTRHSVYLQQLEKGEAARVGLFMQQKVFPNIYQKLINELNKVKDIESIGSIRRVKRLNQMLAAVRQTSVAGLIRAEKQMVSRLVDVSKFEAQWNVNTIERTVPLDIDLVMPSNAVLRELVTTKSFEGHKLDTWFKSLSKSVRANVNKQLRVGIASGESVPALGKRVQKVFKTGTRQAQAIARTATSSVVHHAREEVFKRNKSIIPKVQWTATLDDRTTVICINLDGKIFETGKGPRPPIHFQCRSTVVPITPSWQEFGVTDPPPATRASMNGAVPAKTTYKQWLRKQPKSVQVKVLGKKKAELYRSGRVKIEKFTSRDLKPLTLKQIARREGLAAPSKRAAKVKAKLQPKRVTKVKAKPIKANGKEFTNADKLLLQGYTDNNYHNIVNTQLGKSLQKQYKFKTRVEALAEAKKIENSLLKLDGYKGISYRGLTFASESSKNGFMSKFNVGSIWKSKSFQSTSRSRKEIEFFLGRGADANNVVLRIEGLSGRNIAKYSPSPNELEVLFAKNTAFKTIKIKRDEIWLKEVTK